VLSGNSAIEKIPLFVYDADQLPFAPEVIALYSVHAFAFMCMHCAHALYQSPRIWTHYSHITIPQTCETIERLTQVELEAHLTGAYRALSDAAIGAPVQSHIVCYLHTIVTVAAVANVCANSSMLPLLLKMAKRARSVSQKAEIVTVCGVVIRHATHINSLEGM
jgi:hypothetical protein